ncbi:MAG: hypothetical protein HC934_00395 [Acaryochloridaceae cyanobacterium SU_2_1]|nr:hypothetical protein [Acaryochloridaceae cyanobacterium SU_2_1]
MNMNQTQRLLLSPSSLRSWLTFFALIWLMGFIGLGWLVKSLLVLTLLLLLTPLVLFVGLRWWLSRNLIQGACPACGKELAGLKNTQTTCPHCTQRVQIQTNAFQRPTEPGTIDVQAIDVTSQILD